MATLRREIPYRYRRKFLPYLLMLPTLAGMALVLFYPIGRVVVMSFLRWDLVDPERNGAFVGLLNYVNLVKTPLFWTGVRVTAILTAGVVAGAYLLGLATALVLNESFPGRGLARGIILLPWSVSYVVASIIWNWIYNSEFGVLNFLLRRAGLIHETVNWLTDPKVAIWALLAVMIWLEYPFVTMMLLAGLQSIQKELYEAAAIDGAGAWQRFWAITMPGLSGANTVVLVLTVLWVFRNFVTPKTLTGGGPVHSTETLVLQTYQHAFLSYNMASASALGIITLLIISLLTAGYYLVLRRRGAAT